MRNYFTRLPMHWIMLPVFFILHTVNEYYGLLNGAIVLLSLGYYLLLTLGIFFIGKLIFKSFKKSAVWATVLLSIFFFWGAFHDFLKGLGLPRFFSSYTLLLPVLFFLLLCLTWVLRKSKDVNKSTIFLNLLFAILLMIDLAQIAYKYLSPVDENDLSRNNPSLNIDLKPVADSLKPDIYFIVFDEYASSLSLKKYFNFDNHALDSMLKANGFYIAKKAKSNYNATPLSVSSTFNMQYYRLIGEGADFDPTNLQRAWYTLDRSYLPKLLKKEGYSVFSHSINLNGDIAPSTFNSVVQKGIFSRHTLISRLKKDIFWNFYSVFPFLFNESSLGREHARDKINFNNLMKDMTTKRNSPRFIYTHLMIPHPPFRYGRNGEIKEFTPEQIKSGEGYIEQVLFANKLIGKIVASIKSTDRPVVIIIEGDHGYRGGTPAPATRDTKFMNLNTFYFSDKDYSLLYDSISPVNTFRVVLNKYFKTNLPLLKDTTVLINYK